MKRCYLGMGMLAALLIVAICSTCAMCKCHEAIEKELNQAAQAAMLGDWEGADQAFTSAKADWDQSAHFRACFADHTPVEEAEAKFALLEVYCAAQENAAFAGGCKELARMVAAVGEAHEFVWWNLL